MKLNEHFNPTWGPSQALSFLKRVRIFVEGLVGSDVEDIEVIRDTMEGVEDVDMAFNKLLDLRNDCLALAGAYKERAKDYAGAAKHAELRAEVIEEMLY